jgi:hypothetical protein
MIKPEKIKDALKINENNLEYEMVRQSELLYWLGNEVANAEHIADSKKAQLELLESKKSNKFRRIAYDTGEKMTVDELKSKVKSCKSVINLRDELLDAQRYAKSTQTAHRALVAKGEMLSQLSFNRRKEMDYNIKKKADKQRLRKKLNS